MKPIEYNGQYYDPVTKQLMINGNTIRALLIDGDDTFIQFSENFTASLVYARSLVKRKKWKKFIMPIVWSLDGATLGIKDAGATSATEFKLKLFLVMEALLLLTSPTKFLNDYFGRYYELEFEKTEEDGKGGVITASEVIAELSKRYKIIVASNNSQNGQFFLDRGIPKEAIYVPHARGNAKKPKLYLKILEDYGYKECECAAVGDSMRDDIIGAKAVGLYTVLFGHVSDEKIAWSNPDYHCKSLIAILEILVPDI